MVNINPDSFAQAYLQTFGREFTVDEALKIYKEAFDAANTLNKPTSMQKGKFAPRNF